MCDDRYDYGETPREFAYPEFPLYYFYNGHNNAQNFKITEDFVISSCPGCIGETICVMFFCTISDITLILDDNYGPPKIGTYLTGENDESSVYSCVIRLDVESQEAVD